MKAPGNYECGNSEGIISCSGSVCILKALILNPVGI
jgi:hypothetical protein